MLIYDHLVGYTYLGELQKMRMHNVAALSTGSTPTALGLVQYLTPSNSLHVHVGSDSWKRLAMSGDNMPATGFTLTNGRVWMGDGSNVPQEYDKSSIPINQWGAATGNINLGGFKITGSATITGSDADSTVATVGYVNSVAQGLDAKGSCLIASNAALPACTYSAGSLTLTANANGAMTATTIDSTASGSTLVVGSRVLIKNQAVSEQNGIYVVNSLGSAGTPWSLIRAVDANTNAELESAFTFVEEGAAANSGWVQTSDLYDITAPTSNLITWTQFSSAGSYTAGKGMILSGGNVFNFAKSTAYAQGDLFYGITGGAGDAATTKVDILSLGTAGEFLQVNSGATAPVWSAYRLPSTISGANSLLLSSSTSVVGELVTANNSVLTTNGSGVVAWGTSLPSTTTHAGNYIYRASGTDVPLLDGGTNASLSASAGSIVYGTASAMAFSSVGTSGHFMRSGGTGAPTWFNLFGTSNTWSGEQTYSTAANQAVNRFKLNADVDDRIRIHSGGTLAFGLGTAAPNLYMYAVSSAAVAMQMNLHFAPVGAVPSELTFANSSDTYRVGFKAPIAMANNTIWTLPVVDIPNGYWKSNGSGVLQIATISAGEIGSGEALTRTNDTNVTVTLGGSASTCLLSAASLTLGWTGTLAVGRGGTGLATITTNAVPYGNGTGAMQLATVAANTVLASTGGAPAFTGQPTLATGIITNGQNAHQINPFNTGAGQTGELRFLELAANGTAYVGFKAPDAITGVGFVWTLPSADADGVLHSNGAGVLSFGPVTTAELSGAAALTKTDDTNVTLTLGGSPASSLLAATSLTLGWTGTLAVSRGGTGLSTATQYGVLYASSTSATAWSAAPTVTGSILRGNTAGAPSWSGYAMPATLAGANRLFLSASSSSVVELAPTADRVLVTNGSSVVSWGGLLNVARNTAGGIARKWSNQVVGDGANAFISITHNLNTRDVVVSARNSVSGDTGSQEIGYTKITVEDANTVRVYFNTIQTASNYYVVTVIG